MNALESRTPYELLGGEPAVRRLAQRFYDLMDTNGSMAELRAMHASDLGPMREKLFDFLSGWLGGPARYFERPDRQCMGSVHAAYRIGELERGQWLGCMSQALAELEADAATVRLIEVALGRMTEAMRNA